ncbi:hypothetical protein N9M66_00775 [Litoreibacter sp.]|nr:hypothetical protein [Litoreibacter sp.]
MTQRFVEDLNTILDRLIAHPDQLDDIRDVLLRKLSENRPAPRPRLVSSRPVEDDVDFFDNFPV